MTLLELIAFILCGVITSLWLRKFFNKFRLTWWRLFILIAYNSFFGSGYIGLVKANTIWRWSVPDEIFDYPVTIMVLFLTLVLFHCWCVVSVRGFRN